MAKYAAPAGGGGSDSNPGTQASPYLTIDKLAKNLDSDKIGYLRGTGGGVYNESVNLNTYGGLFPSGTSGLRVLISAYPNETVTINGRFNFANQNVAYVTFQDLHINAAGLGENAVGDNAPAVTVDHIRFDGCEIYNADTNGVGGGGTSYEFLNCDVHDNGDNINGTDTAEHGFYVTSTGTGAGTLDGCTVYENASLGLTMYPSPTNWTIKNCIFYNNGNAPAPLNGLGDPICTPGNIQMGGSGHLVFNNICYYTSGFTGLVGNGIQIGASASNCEIYHNNCYQNSTGIYNFTGSTGTIIKNNVCYLNTSDDYLNIGSVASEDYNDFADGTGTGGHDIAVNPGWASPNTGDFSITSSDPIYAACPRLGTVMTDFDGNPRPDPASMGALEPPAGPPPVAGNGSYSQISLGSLPDDPSHFIGPTCRNNILLDSFRSYYTVQLSRSGSTYILSLAKILNGVYVHITDTSAETFTSGDSLRLEVTGSTTVMLSVKKNDVEILASTDTSLTADTTYGFAGGGATDAPALNWSAGNINAGVLASAASSTLDGVGLLGMNDGFVQQAPLDGLMYYTGSGSAAGGAYASVDAVVYWVGITAAAQTILGVGGGG